MESVQRNTKKKGELEEVWGLLRCTNLKCKVITKKGEKRSIYNRDYNSCKNMLKIVENIRECGDRPKKYKKE